MENKDKLSLIPGITINDVIQKTISLSKENYVDLKHNQQMTEEQKAAYLVRLMGKSLAIRYVNTKIAHFNNEEFINIRMETKEYWESVKSLMSNFTNPFKD